MLYGVYVRVRVCERSSPMFVGRRRKERKKEKEEESRSNLNSKKNKIKKQQFQCVMIFDVLLCFFFLKAFSFVSFLIDSREVELTAASLLWHGGSQSASHNTGSGSIATKDDVNI